MQGYAILAESLAKQKIQNCYGIVGKHLSIQVYQSSSLDLPSRAMASTIMVAETNNRPAIVPDTLATLLASQEYAFASLDRATPTPSAELLMLGPIAGL